MTVRVTAGPVGTAATRSRAEAVQDLLATELERTRAAADKWRAGLAALLGLITTLMVIKGRATIEGISPAAQVMVGVMLLLAFICVVSGALLSMLAAFGNPSAERLTGDPHELQDYDRRTARDAVVRLRWAMALTVAALVLLAGAVGVTWYAPATAAAQVRIHYGKAGSVCGTLRSMTGRRVIIESGGAMVRIQAPALRGAEVVKSC